MTMIKEYQPSATLKVAFADSLKLFEDVLFMLFIAQRFLYIVFFYIFRDYNIFY